MPASNDPVFRGQSTVYEPLDIEAVPRGELTSCPKSSDDGQADHCPDLPQPRFRTTWGRAVPCEGQGILRTHFLRNIKIVP